MTIGTRVPREAKAKARGNIGQGFLAFLLERGQVQPFARKADCQSNLPIVVSKHEGCRVRKDSFLFWAMSR